MAVCPGLTKTKLIEYPENSGTFDYVKEEVAKVANVAGQEADICGKNIVKAMQTGKNGSIWICVCGNLREAAMPDDVEG